MNAKSIPITHGIDDSKVFESSKKIISSDRITYTRNTGANWVTAVSNSYKIVISKSEEAWMFDLVKDPNELYNVYNKKGYENISSKFVNALKSQMKEFKDPGLKGAKQYNY